MLAIVYSLTGFGQTWVQLNSRVTALFDKGEYEKAVTVSKQAIEMAKSQVGEESRRYAISLNKLGELYDKTGDYEKAEPLFIQAIRIRKKIFGDSHPDYATSLDNLGRLYMDMGQSEKAEPFVVKAKEIRKKVFGERHSDYAKSLYSMAWLYTQKGQYAAAEPLFIQCREIRKRTLGESNADYADAVGSLGAFYFTTGKYEKVESLDLQAKQIRQKVLGENHVDYGYSLYNLATFYNLMGQYDKAEPVLIQAKEIWKKILGEDKPDYATGLNSLSSLYVHMGQFEKAEPLSIEAVKITKRALGENSVDFGTSLYNLAILYFRMGKYEKAEPLYIKYREILKSLYGENNLDYAESLNGLAALYDVLGQYEKAKALLIQVTEIQGKLLGKENPIYAIGLNNLAVLYYRTGQNEKAEPLFLEEEEITKKALGEDHPDYAVSLNNLGSMYRDMGQYQKAEPIYLKAAEIRKKALGENHPNYAISLYNLGILYDQMELFDKAEPLYIQAKEIQKKALGEDNPDYAKSLGSLALLYSQMGQFEKAEPLILSCNKIVLKNLKDVFAALSEKEKGNYLQNNVGIVETSNSFLYQFRKASPALVQNNFNLQLFIKSLSLLETRNMLEAMQNNPDSTIQGLFGRWLSDKELLAKQYSLPMNKRIKTIDSVEAEAETFEEELTRRSIEFRRQQNTMNITGSDVEKNLSDSEVAIEFVRFKLSGKTAADSMMYAAYIMGKKDSVPQFVPLCEEKQLQGIFDSAGNTATTMVNKLYRGGRVGGTNASYWGDSLYKLIWQPLEPYLQGVKKIAYAPAGKLFSVAFAALPVTRNTLLMEKYDLQQYSSTRQIALRREENQAATPASIALFGDPRFTMDSSAMVNQRNRQSDSSIGSTVRYVPQVRGNQDNVWVDLPGTAEEVGTIGDLFQKRGLQTSTYMQANASEKNLKALSGHAPQVLHIATHGFFLPEPEKTTRGITFGAGNSYTLADDPLLRSGLIFAGGNYAWSGKAPIEGMDDGIATAYEISRLNLRNTELVVLSACETALGDVKGSEGVFGLQRAFKMAGAKKLIVSLWQVPDKETAELMTTFYLYWMNGKTIEESFRMAQADMRRKYPPYYWAAFVLVD